MMNTNNNWNHINVIRSQAYDYYTTDRNNLNNLRSNSLTGYEDINGNSHNSVGNTYHYSSVMDVDKSGTDVKKFSWNSPQSHHKNSSNHHVIRKGQKHTATGSSRPFESSFKTAISKMKETSLNHLGSVEKTNTQGRISTSSTGDNFYFDRDSQLKQQSHNPNTTKPRTTNGNCANQNTTSGSSVRIFRCNSVANNINGSKNPSSRHEPLSSVSSAYNMPTDEYVNSFLGDGPNLPTRHRHRSGNETESNKKWSYKTQTNSLDRNKTTGSKILIPIKGTSNQNHDYPISQSHVKQSFTEKYKAGNQLSYNNKEPAIRSTHVKQVHSNYPKTIIHQHSNSQDGDASNSDPNTDPLPSVQEIIAKVEALNVESPLRTPTNIVAPQQQSKDTSKHFFATSAQLQKMSQTSHKIPVTASPATNSYYCSTPSNNVDYQPRQSNSFPRSGQFPQIQSKRQERIYQQPAGSYNKTSNSPVKSKTISNFPVDFQKLHSAFLDQKNEITRLKKELEEKKLIIADLQSHLKTYEPWR